MPVALNHAAIAVYRNDIYVAGGYQDPNRSTSHLLRYDPPTDRWTRLAKMPTRRGALTAGVIEDRLYAAGGADMPTPRHGLGVVAHGRRVFTIQGGPQPGFHFSNALESLMVPAGQLAQTTANGVAEQPRRYARRVHDPVTDHGQRADRADALGDGLGWANSPRRSTPRSRRGGTSTLPRGPATSRSRSTSCPRPCGRACATRSRA